MGNNGDKIEPRVWETPTQKRLNRIAHMNFPRGPFGIGIGIVNAHGSMIQGIREQDDRAAGMFPGEETTSGFWWGFGFVSNSPELRACFHDSIAMKR